MTWKELVLGKAKTFRNDVRMQMAAAITAGFAFVIALSWNDFIKQFVTDVTLRLGLDGDALYIKFATLLFVTIFCIVGIQLASRWGAKKEEPAASQEKK